MDLYINKNQKKLKCGYTTGTCAAAAATAAASMLLLEKEYKCIPLITPKGIEVTIPIDSTEIEESIGIVTCSVIKDSGDDPDITNGIRIFAKVSLGGSQIPGEERVFITGGIGIGTVTKPGLEQEIGSPAINKVPRQMIKRAVETVCMQADYADRIMVEISAPEGVEIAKKTFNPRLGIKGGISILGTSGIVEPMSDKALIDTIETELKVSKAQGKKHLLVSPGNYGMEYIRKDLKINSNDIVKCSNYIGETIDLAASCSFESLLFVGNFGKLVKLSGGIMNTHSKVADARFEIIGVHAALCGASKQIIQEIMNCITTEQALDILVEYEICEETMSSILKKIDQVIKNRAGEELKVGVILFSEKRGFLGKSKLADELIKYHGI